MSNRSVSPVNHMFVKPVVHLGLQLPLGAVMSTFSNQMKRLTSGELTMRDLSPIRQIQPVWQWTLHNNLLPCAFYLVGDL